MKLKRLLAMVLSVLMLAALAGCGTTSSDSSASASASSSASDSASASASASADASAEASASASTSEEETVPAEIPAEAEEDVVSYLTDGAFTADTVVGSVGDIDITAGEVLYLAESQYYNITYYYAAYYYSTVTYSDSWSSDQTVGEYCLSSAIEVLTSYVAAQQRAGDTSVSLSDDLLEQLATLTETNIQNYGQNRWDAAVEDGTIDESAYTDEQKAEWITEEGTTFYQHSMMYFSTTEEMYKNVMTAYYYYTTMQSNLFDDGGEYAMTDATLADYTQSYIEDNGVLWGRCILFSTTDLEDDQTEDDVFAEAESVYNELSGLTGDELSEAFTEKQTAYDGSGYTAGEVQEYTNSDSLVDGYYSGLEALQPGEIAMTGLTDYGYFILLREADDPDSLADTVKSQYISDKYDSLLTQWSTDYGTQFDEAFTGMDTNSYFAKLEELQTIINSIDYGD